MTTANVSLAMMCLPWILNVFVAGRLVQDGFARPYWRTYTEVISANRFAHGAMRRMGYAIVEITPRTDADAPCTHPNDIAASDGLGLALPRGASVRPRAGDVPREADQDYRSLCAGRRHGCGRAHARAGHGEGPWRVRHHREQTGGRDHHRNPVGGREHRRRLYAVDGYVLACGQFEPQREAALRSAQGFRRRCADRAFLQHRRRQSEVV